MLSGRRLDLLDPNAGRYRIEDMRTGSLLWRVWNGQTRGDFAYSVADMRFWSKPFSGE